MHSFKDNAGRAWVVEIHVTAIKRARGLVGVDLYGLVDDGFAGLAKLLGDPVSLVDVLYVLSRPAVEGGPTVSDEDFGRAMGGDSLEAAANAFVAEFTDFFPDPRVRAGLKKVAEKGKAVQSILLDSLDGVLAGISPEDEARKLIASFGSSPGPSASTPAPSPSASST